MPVRRRDGLKVVLKILDWVCREGRGLVWGGMGWDGMGWEGGNKGGGEGTYTEEIDDAGSWDGHGFGFGC